MGEPHTSSIHSMDDKTSRFHKNIAALSDRRFTWAVRLPRNNSKRENDILSRCLIDESCQSSDKLRSEAPTITIQTWFDFLNPKQPNQALFPERPS